MLRPMPARLPCALCMTALFAACAPAAREATDASAPQAISATGSTSGADAVNPATSAANGNTAQAANVTAVPWPSLDFVNNPGGKDAKAVALSFDDAPDGMLSAEGKAGHSNLAAMLDQLKALQLHATFFVCGNKGTDVTTDSEAQADVKRILAEGHAIGSHTRDHIPWDPNTMTVAQAKAQISGNYDAFSNAKVFGSSMPPFTMWRAPKGIPFESDLKGTATMGAAGANAGVHVGWGIDPMDWDCAERNQDSNCILTNLNEYLDRGASGVILMHAIYKLSADTLPAVVKSITAHGYHIVMVEDLILDKYGASSADLTAAGMRAKFSDQQLNDAAVNASKLSKWVLHTNE